LASNDAHVGLMYIILVKLTKV